MTLAQIGCPEISTRFVEAIRCERGAEPKRMRLDVNWRELFAKRPAERILELRACGYGNDAIAEILGYKDARSVRAQINRYRTEAA